MRLMFPIIAQRANWRSLKYDINILMTPFERSSQHWIHGIQVMASKRGSKSSHNLPFFALGPWAIIHGIAKLANTFISQI